jgi:hypothetical protein
LFDQNQATSSSPWIWLFCPLISQNKAKRIRRNNITSIEK